MFEIISKIIAFVFIFYLYLKFEKMAEHIQEIKHHQKIAKEHNEEAQHELLEAIYSLEEVINKKK